MVRKSKSLETSTTEHVDVIDRVRQEVLGMVKNGEIEPGERVNEVNLAQRLNIGRNIAREALRTLEYAGIIRIVPNRGAEVRKISMEEAIDLYEVRAGLSRAAGRAIAKRADREDIRVLNGLQAELARIIDEGNDLEYNRVNIEFHATLMNASRNPRLIVINADIEDELSLYMTRGTYSPGALRDSLVEHQAIVTAIERGDEEQAGAAFERHVLNGRQRVLEGQTVLML